MLIGYARVSTLDQDTALQLDALKGVGVKQIYQDKSSGVGPRPQLRQVIASLRRGDILVVWKLDRIARSLSDLLSIIGQVRAAGAAIKSLTEPVDTSSPIGEFTLQVLGAVAQLERSMIRERTRAGVHAAIARGQRWGRPPRITDREKLEIRYLIAHGWPSVVVRDAYGISARMVYNINSFRPNNKKPTV